MSEAVEEKTPVTLPVIAIVGRPNVGKSSLFNAVVGRKLAIVHEMSGVTRDRVSCDVRFQGQMFTLVDTGGLNTLDDTEKNVEFTKADFIPTKDTNGSIDKVRNIDIAFGLWNYDTTQNELEIEISKFEIVLPAENSK